MSKFLEALALANHCDRLSVRPTGRAFLNARDFNNNTKAMREKPAKKLKFVFAGRLWTVIKWRKRGFAVEFS